MYVHKHGQMIEFINYLSLSINMKNSLGFSDFYFVGVASWLKKSYDGKEITEKHSFDLF